jgi:hypothetical protein
MLATGDVRRTLFGERSMSVSQRKNASSGATGRRAAPNHRPRLEAILDQPLNSAAPLRSRHRNRTVDSPSDGHDRSYTRQALEPGTCARVSASHPSHGAPRTSPRSAQFGPRLSRRQSTESVDRGSAYQDLPDHAARAPPRDAFSPMRQYRFFSALDHHWGSVGAAGIGGRRPSRLVATGAGRACKPEIRSGRSVWERRSR